MRNGSPDTGNKEDGGAQNENRALADFSGQRDPEKVTDAQEKDIERDEVTCFCQAHVKIFDNRDQNWSD